MSRVEAAAATDRLPWLPDEPKPTQAKRRSAFAPWAAGIVLAVAGIGFWLGVKSVAAANSGSGHSLRSGRRLSDCPRLARSSLMFASLPQPEVPIAPAPQVRRAPEPEVRIAPPPAERKPAHVTISERSRWACIGRANGGNTADARGAART